MKRLLFPILLIVISLLSACQSKELEFIGEGERWLAKVTVNQTDGDETYTIEISYKGEGVKNVETFSYDIESSDNGVLEYGVLEASLNEQGVYKGQMLSSNSPSTSSEDELVLKVEWNGESEIFILRNDV